MTTTTSAKDSDKHMVPNDSPQKTILQGIGEALNRLVSDVPKSHETVLQAPSVRVNTIAETAALKAAGVSALLAVVPGPLGMLSIIPALVEIWNIQRQMVADIAACYGKTAQLIPEMMLYCLFRQGAAAVFKETIIQIGGRLMVRRVSLRVVQQLIQKISVNVTQRVLSQIAARWLPIVGSVALGTFTYWDTKRIAKTAIETFEKEIDTEEGTIQTPTEKPELPTAVVRAH